MKVVVMSDTHLDRVTDAFMTLCSRYCDDADMVIHLGDWSRSPILDFLEQYPLEAVSGNMDDHVLRNRLPAKKVIRIEGHRIGITHGWGSARDLRSRLLQEFDDVDAILFGHTHQPLVLQENAILWFNPGSVFHGRQGAASSLGILHVRRVLAAEIIRL